MSSKLEQNLKNKKINQTEKTRKRTRNPEKHEVFKQNLKTQKGLERITKSGNVIRAKKFREQTECEGKCKKKCWHKIDVTRQKQIFNTFYGLENWSKKILYLRSIVKILPANDNLNSVKCIAKENRHKYYLTNSNGVHEEVCHRFFLNCLQVSKSSLNRSINSAITNELANEKRGKCCNRKTDERDLNFVMKFIRRFPCYRSHYAATKSGIKFLNPHLNIVRLYREYKIVCEFNKRKAVSEWKFRHVFNTKFNLGFKPIKTDTCRTCDKLNAAIGSERTHTLKREFNHKQITECLGKNFNDTKNFVRDLSNNTEMFTFDLQRALELPCITTSEAYYRRQLWLYNLCVYDEKRGAQEITSCLLKHFRDFVPPEATNIILYSDSCGGQNRNIKTTLMLKKCMDSWPYSALTSIEQRFFMSGHSYNSCDRCFGLIELQKRITERIMIPQHWIDLIAQAKKNEPKFTVVQMKKKDFFSSGQLEIAITNRKIAKNGEKVNWLHIQKIINHRSKSFDITIGRYGNPPSPYVDISLHKRGHRSQLISSLSRFKFTPLYTESRPIKREKYNDLMKLLQFIPEEFWSFYQRLKCNDEPKKNVPEHWCPQAMKNYKKSQII